MKKDENTLRRARQLRREMTKEERHLWYDFLRNYPVHVYRQKPLGPFIADFYCPSAKLVIELDGSQHYDPQNQAYDSERSAYLKQHFDIDTLRIPNNEVTKNFSSVCTYIAQRLPPPGTHKTIGSPLPGGAVSEAD